MRTRPWRKLLGTLAFVTACSGPTNPAPTDDASEQSTEEHTSSPEACESDEFGLVDVCVGEPNGGGECSCGGLCEDEATQEATRQFGGNCDYIPRRVVCSAGAQAGECCYTVEVEVSC